MVRDNVVFRITVDGKQAQATFNALEAQVKKLGGTIDRVNPKTQQLGAGISNAGNNAAASAVNFQTATQGMLNLSTAAVQTFTSISNLDRANNRAKQSIIAVARAEDLLNNKQERLRQLQQSGTASAQQLANMQREVATATADLTVKQEKQAIEQAAVNDVYMLFATNVANVTISSLQTIGVLLGQNRMATIASSMATKLHSITTWDNWRAQKAANLAQKENLIGLKALPPVNAAAAASLQGLTFKTRIATFAMNAFKVALGPIGLIMIGVSAAMVAYESNLGGIKDTINELLGVQDDFQQNLEDTRNNVDELETSTSELDRTTRKLPSSYDDAVLKLGQYRKELTKTTEEAQKLSIAQQLISSTRPTTLAGFRSPVQAGVSKQRQIGLFEQFLTGEYQTAAAEPFIPRTAIEIAQEEAVKKGLDITTTPKGTIAGIPIGVGKIMIGGEDVTAVTGDIAMFEAVVNSATARQLISEAEELGKVRQYFTPKDTITGNFLIPTIDFGKRFDPAMGGKFLVEDNPDFTIADSDFIRDVRSGKLTDLTREQRRKFKDLMEKFFGREKDTDKDKSRDLTKLSNREFIQRALFTDLGEVANSIDRQESIRLAILEKSLQTETRDLSHMGSISASNAHVFNMANNARNEEINRAIIDNGQAFIRMSNLNDIRSLTDGIIGQDIRNITTAGNINHPVFATGRPTNFFGTGFFKSTGATAAFQVPRGSIKVPSWVRDRQAQQDLNLNRLKTGGKRVGFIDPQTGEFQPSFQIWEEGAVEGGFTNIATAREFWRREFNRNANEAESFLSQLGKKVGKGYTVRSSAGTAIAQVAQMKGLLARTGLSLSALPTVGDFMPKRGGGGLGNVGNRYGAMMANIHNQAAAAQSAAIAANQLTLKRAGEIDVLQGGFGLTGFFGSALSLQELQLKTAQQDALVQSIGLNRTEAFKIIDTQGRGRNEIDDRVRWTQRNESISTGASVL